MKWLVGFAVLVLVAVVAWKEWKDVPQDTALDSLRASHAESLAVFRVRDSLRQAVQDSLTQETQRLRARTPALRTRTDTLLVRITDSLLADSLTTAIATERAVSDSLHRADSLIILSQDSTIFDLRRLLVRSDSIGTVALASRDYWRRKARPIGIGCAAGVGGSVRGVHLPSVTCGVVVRLRIPLLSS